LKLAVQVFRTLFVFYNRRFAIQTRLEPLEQGCGLVCGFG